MMIYFYFLVVAFVSFVVGWFIGYQHKIENY